ncbi:MAG: hypothetical protein KIT31_05200 [Deltaproteobacteria bacterium]|nr:hypothetical protein [Deltaproteobacteria bacterium]
MARQKRGGFRTPELRGTLGTLLRTTLQQAGAVRDAARDVLERGAREGRSRLDEARNHRRRHDALAELGEVVLRLIRDGEIDVAELPEAAEIVRHLDDLDDSRGPSDDDPDAPPSPLSPLSPLSPSTRRRFDDRGDTVSSGAVWRPPSADRTRDEAPTLPPPTRRDPAKKGGIRFDDDEEDLEEYMHPDDVPAKPTKE